MIRPTQDTASDSDGRDGAEGQDLPAISTEPLYVLEDEHGDLFLSSAEVCSESSSKTVLHDHALWDAYFAACVAANKARRAVLNALHHPWRETTPETLTMRQIADVKQWASENGRKGLYADAIRCETAGDVPMGAMRRICKHINESTKP